MIRSLIAQGTGVSPVPLSAGLLLIAGAIATLALVRRRARSL